MLIRSTKGTNQDLMERARVRFRNTGEDPKDMDSAVFSYSEHCCEIMELLRKRHDKAITMLREQNEKDDEKKRT